MAAKEGRREATRVWCGPLHAGGAPHSPACCVGSRHGCHPPQALEPCRRDVRRRHTGTPRRRELSAARVPPAVAAEAEVVAWTERYARSDVNAFSEAAAAAVDGSRRDGCGGVPPHVAATGVGAATAALHGAALAGNRLGAGRMDQGGCYT